MKRMSSGFTLIELVTVIVILGALAAVAVPKFIDLQDDAQQAAVEQVAGNLSSAGSVNLAGALAGDSDAVAITACTPVASALQGGLPGGFQIVSLNTPGTASTGVNFTCDVGDGNFTSSFQAFNVPNNP